MFIIALPLCQTSCPLRTVHLCEKLNIKCIAHVFLPVVAKVPTTGIKTRNFFLNTKYFNVWCCQCDETYMYYPECIIDIKDGWMAHNCLDN